MDEESKEIIKKNYNKKEVASSYLLFRLKYFDKIKKKKAKESKNILIKIIGISLFITFLLIIINILKKNSEVRKKK